MKVLILPSLDSPGLFVCGDLRLGPRSPPLSSPWNTFRGRSAGNKVSGSHLLDIFIAPSLLKEDFTGYGILGWCVFSSTF